jgi:hypothetical protein
VYLKCIYILQAASALYKSFIYLFEYLYSLLSLSSIFLSLSLSLSLLTRFVELCEEKKNKNGKKKFGIERERGRLFGTQSDLINTSGLCVRASQRVFRCR